MAQLLGEKRDGYAGRVRFVDLRDRSRSRKGPVAKAWVQSYFRVISDRCPYKCVVVGQQSQNGKLPAFKEHNDLSYEKTSLAIHGELAWSFRSHESITLDTGLEF